MKSIKFENGSVIETIETECGKRSTRNNRKEEKYYELYEELVEISNKIRPYYDIDKIKSYSVYIWSKEGSGISDDFWGRNVFDIEAEGIFFYDKEHKVIEDAIPIIKEIQLKLNEIQELVKQKN